MLWNIVRKECILTKKKRTLTTFQFYKAESCDLQDHQHHLQEIMEQPGLLRHLRYCNWALCNTHSLERKKLPKIFQWEKVVRYRIIDPNRNNKLSFKKDMKTLLFLVPCICPLHIFLMSVNFSLVWMILNQSFVVIVDLCTSVMF